jgi:hypothetical protein
MVEAKLSKHTKFSISKVKKEMLVQFSGSQKIIHNEFFPPGRTVNKEEFLGYSLVCFKEFVEQT